MKRLIGRLVALEALAANAGGMFDLDCLTDAELAQLEGICIRVEDQMAGGATQAGAINALPPADLQLVMQLPGR